jgi:hypothetical protein
MKLGTWLWLLWCLGAYCGCGGAEFTVSVFPDGGEPLTATAADAGDSLGEQDAHPVMTMAGDAGDARKVARHDDAGELVDAASPASEAGPDGPSSGPSPDAAADDEPPPPPPPLCCMTPCGGSTPAPITCGNGPAWTCAAGSCSDHACAVGAVCDWMGSTCMGRVAACP